MNQIVTMIRHLHAVAARIAEMIKTAQRLMKELISVNHQR
jgi:hypothetical protein